MVNRTPPADATTVNAAAKQFGAASLLFDPTAGEVVLEPEGRTQGYWVGAPSVLWDEPERCWWLTYRRRRPRGVNPDGLGERGYVARVARSADGVRFDDVWQVTQGEWRSPSMEKFSLARDEDGTYRLYTSYVDPTDNRWRIDLLEAPRPDQFDAGQAQPVFTAASAAQAAGRPVEGVKDPYVFRVGRIWHMLISYAAARPPQSEDERQRMHGTADIYNTGLTTAPTALATSPDGVTWQWAGEILPVSRDGWDSYQSRLNSCVWLSGLWFGFYDGAASERENYEEHCGLAVSLDLRRWTKLTPDGPAIVAPHGTGSVRYVEGVLKGGALHCYYEYVRPDAAHELRRIVVPLT
jgi:hypothetical protein